MKSDTDYFLAIPEEEGTGRAFGLAALMHVLLILFLCYGLYWQNNASSGVEVELWTDVPEVQPAISASEHAPVPATPPAPRLFSMPPTEQADISLRKDEKQQPKRTRTGEGVAAPKLPTPSASLKVEQQERRVLTAQNEALKNSQQQQKVVQQQKEQQLARERLMREMKTFEIQRAKTQAEHKRQDRLENLRQMANAPQTANRGGARAAGGQSGAHAGSGGAGGPGYADKVRQRVKPNIVFNAQEVAGNPQAVVEVECAPDGAILNVRLSRSSGDAAWDNAVLRAVEKSDPMPRGEGQQTPRRFVITFQPKD